MKSVLVIDTSILCVWLEVPGMDNCGPNGDKWDKKRVEAKIQEERSAGATFVLPLATIIETGNHIAQAKHSQEDRAKALADLMHKSAEEETPWAAFAHQTELWSPEKLRKLAEDWPALARQKMSLGDATIKDVAEYYADSGYQVEILTGDKGLKAYQPSAPAKVPRRRQRG
jgi:hypothetical protein